MANPERHCAGCKQDKVRSSFSRKQWERKKYRRCRQCTEQGVPFQRPSKKTYRIDRNPILSVPKKETLNEQDLTEQASSEDSINNNSIEAIDENENKINRLNDATSKRLRYAKRCLLQRKHQDAWITCNHFFHTTQQEDTDENLKDVVMIDYSIGQSEPLKIKVLTSSSENTELDQMIVIALQCCQEINCTHDFVRLEPLIQAISARHMSLQVFCVWIEFWQASNFWKEALEWTYKVLLNTQEDELLIKFLGHQLPRLQNSEVAHELLHQLFENKPRSVSELELNPDCFSMPSAQSIHAIRSVLEHYSLVDTCDTVLSSDAWSQILQEWEPFCNEEREVDPDNKSNDENLSLLPQPTLSLVDHFLRWMRQQVRTCVQRIKENPRFRYRLTVSLALTLVGWRKRKSLGYLLVPIKELLDALKLSG